MDNKTNKTTNKRAEQTGIITKKRKEVYTKKGDCH